MKPHLRGPVASMGGGPRPNAVPVAGVVVDGGSGGGMAARSCPAKERWLSGCACGRDDSGGGSCPPPGVEGVFSDMARQSAQKFEGVYIKMRDTNRGIVWFRICAHSLFKKTHVFVG